MSYLPVYVSRVLLFSLLFVGQSRAQVISRNDPRMFALFGEAVAKPAQSTVRIRSDGKEVALGTIISADGWIVTKASEVAGRKLICKLHDNRELEAIRGSVDQVFDIGLLKVEAKDLTPVVWSESKIARPGRWVASAGPGKEPVMIGVVSVATRNIVTKGAAPAPSPTSGHLGVGVDLDFAGVKLTQVTAGGPAQKAGLKVGDQIVALNGEAIDNADEFLVALQRTKVGEVLSLKVSRDDKEFDVKVTLAKRAGNSKGDVQNSWGSTLSERRTGFPTVLQHDSILRPNDCGGPLVDLDGKVVGINIARAGRTESYAVPAEIARTLVEKLKK